MRYDELPEYIDTLRALKQQYADRINIHIGLETEYLPSFDTSGYYKELTDNTGIEFLLLGYLQSGKSLDEVMTFLKP